MPDRLPSLVLLVGFWIPPAVVGWTAAKFLFQLDRMLPYIPGSSYNPTYAPPEAVAGLGLVASALVLPGSAIACALAFRSRVRALRRTTDVPASPEPGG